MPLQFLPKIIKFLMGGAEISVARLLRLPIPRFGKIRRIVSMLGKLSNNELDQILDIANRGISSGRKVTEGIKIGHIEVTDIYEQPYLFGDNPAGRRGYAELDVFDPNIGHKIRVSADWSDPDQLLNLQKVATDELQAKIDRSPSAFGVPKGFTLDPAQIVVTFAERRF